MGGGDKRHVIPPPPISNHGWGYIIPIMYATASNPENPQLTISCII